MDSCYVPWFFTMGVSSFGNPRIEAYLQLPVAYRSLSRPSSAPDAKAFTLCSCSLELPSEHFCSSLFSRFTWIAWVSKHGYFRSKKVFIPSCTFYFSVLRQNCVNSTLAEFCYPLIGKTWSFYSKDSSLSSLSVFRTQFFRFIRFSMNVELSFRTGWRKWARTTDLAIISRVL